MNPNPTEDNEEAQREADREAAGMQQQLSKDIATWSTARTEENAHRTEVLAVPVPKPATPRRVKAQKTETPAPAPAATPARNKPFGMSYGGVSSDQHIRHLIALRHG